MGRIFFPFFYFIFGYTNPKEVLKMKIADKSLLVIFTVFVLIMGILIFILPQKDFSESENRYLAKAPTLSVSAIFSGDYAKDVSSFYTDQFPLRHLATSVYAVSERVLGKKSIGGVILHNNQLIAISQKEETASDIPIPAVCVESKYSLYKKESDELSLYYNTDHHRTTYGAYLLYLEACDALSLTPYPEDYFTRQTACTDFYGTAFFRSRLPKFLSHPDSIELWRYNGDEDVTFTIHDTNTTLKGFYDFSRLDTSDKYAIFLGGNYAYATISSSTNKPSLLLYKDSFANAVIPFLSLHFNIDIVDPRYATRAQMSAAFQSDAYDYKLFIGCLESFG